MVEKFDSVPPSYSDIHDVVGRYRKSRFFFFEDVHFVFDDTLYKFPKHYLKESVFERLFRKELSIGELQKLGIIGSGTLETPFSCLAVTEDQFEALLFLLRLSIVDPKPELIWKQRWLDILEISCMWQMKKVIEMAISYLLRMKVDPITKLELAKRYGIQHKAWRLSAIRDLVRGNEKLTEKDAESIGAGMAVKISRVQGMAHEHPIISGIDHVFGTKNVSWLDAYIHREFPDLF